MKSLRRFLVIQGLMLWQGGFLFYTAFVVPVGTRVLGSAADQGGITRYVTENLNYCGVGAIILCVWDQIVTNRKSLLRWLCLIGMMLTLVALIALHPYMDRFLDAPSYDRSAWSDFYDMHRAYLWLHTIQWLCAFVYVWATLHDWGKDTTPARST